MARMIGIRHRRKRTQEGEARPTEVAIKDGDDVVVHKLEDDTAELDFLMARFPIQWRNVEKDEDISAFRTHHCAWRKVKREEDISSIPEHHVRTRIEKRTGLPMTEVVTKVPTVFEGLKSGDRVAMVLGGSGDRFAAALSRRGEEIDATMFRIPPFVLKAWRREADKDDDYRTLAGLLNEHPELFYQLGRRDRDLIRVAEALRWRQDALRDRIACEQRLIQSHTGRIFLNEDGRYPEGVIEDEYDQLKANDQILLTLLKEEKNRNTELKRAVRAIDLWDVFGEMIAGLGERVFAGIVAPIGDIRRFWVPADLDGVTDPEEIRRRKRKAANRGAAKLKAFCGVHVLAGGKYEDVPKEQQFPRRRRGKTSNWNPGARQAMVLLADQFNRRPDSVWGRKLLENKRRLRERHPDVVEVEVVEDGKKVKRKRYTNGHIHKMALWRTVTRFVEWLFREWTRAELQYRRESVA